MNENWGLRPILFEINGFKVASYPFFVTVALMTGLLIYLYQVRKDEVKSANAFYIVVFALIGGTIGSKIPLLFIYWNELSQPGINPLTYLSGKSIIGGLLGGFGSTVLAKRTLHIQEKMGNQIAIPVAIAMAVGRIACLLQGCCYGKETHTNFGLDFGDHLLRHPTQIYEMVFDLLLAGYLIVRKRKGVAPGALFRIFLNGYLGFRFFNEFLRVEFVGLLGLTDFQWLCVVSLLFINRGWLMTKLKFREIQDDH